MKKLLFICLVLFTATTLYSQKSQSLEGKWFISAGAGAMVYVGENDALAPFSDRVAPTVEVSVGKWVDPLVALRLQFSGFSAKAAAGQSAPYADVQSTPFQNGVYPETFDYTYLHLDVMLNFSALLNGVNQKRVVELVPLVGVGWAHSSKTGVDFSSDNAAVSAGLLGKIRLAKSLNCNIELKGTLVNENMDGVMGNRNGEGMASATIGLAYKF